MSDTTDRYTGILLEDINHKLDAILKGEVSIASLSQKVNNIDERLISVARDVKIIKKVVTAHSHDLKNLKQALT